MQCSMVQASASGASIRAVEHMEQAVLGLICARMSTAEHGNKREEANTFV